MKRGVALSLGLVCIKECIWDSSEVAFIEGYPHVRGGLYEAFSFEVWECPLSEVSLTVNLKCL